MTSRARCPDLQPEVPCQKVLVQVQASSHGAARLGTQPPGVRVWEAASTSSFRRSLDAGDAGRERVGLRVSRETKESAGSHPSGFKIASGGMGPAGVDKHARRVEKTAVCRRRRLTSQRCGCRIVGATADAAAMCGRTQVAHLNMERHRSVIACH